MKHDMDMNHALNEETLEQIAGGAKTQAPKPKYAVGDNVIFWANSYKETTVTGTIRALENAEHPFRYTIYIPEPPFLLRKPVTQTNIREDQIVQKC